MSTDERPIALPDHVAGSGTLDRLVDTAREYARAAASENTLKAYAKDWAHFTRWCRMKGTEPLPPVPEMIGLYLADLASGAGPSPALSVSTIDRRLSGLAWSYAQRGFTLDRKNRHIATGWPESGASMPVRPSRKRRSCPKTFSQWSRPCPTICAGSGIGRSC